MMFKRNELWLKETRVKWWIVGKKRFKSQEINDFHDSYELLGVNINLQTGPEWNPDECCVIYSKAI